MSAKKPAAPQGIPGERADREARIKSWRARIGAGVAASVGLVALTALVGPLRPSLEVPPTGPAQRDLVALRAFDDDVPVPDLVARQERAVADVPIHYEFDEDAANAGVDHIRKAFRLVRPRFRLYRAERDRLTAAIEQARARETAAAATQTHRQRGKRGARGADHAADAGGGSDDAEVPDDALPDAASLVAARERLDTEFNETIDGLRPAFDKTIAARPSELTPDVFEVLRGHGFAEEIELLLSDVAQVALSTRVVKDRERFEDDLRRGVLDTTEDRRYALSATPDVADIEQALRRVDKTVDEFSEQKAPSPFDDAVLRAAVRKLARSMVKPTFVRDIERTHAAEQAAREAVPSTRRVHYERGQALVKRGDLITPQVQRRIRTMLEGVHAGSSGRGFAATGLMLLAALGFFVAFATRYLHHFRHRPRDWALLAGILLVHAAAVRGMAELGALVIVPGGSPGEAAWVAGLPHALGPTLATLFLRPFTAAPFALVCAVISPLVAYNSGLLGGQPALGALVGVMALVLGLAGVHATRRFRARSDLVASAATVSGAGAVVSVGLVLLTAPAASDLLVVDNAWVLGMGVASGALSYLLTAALTPIFESAFNRLTDIKLLELTSMNHPALRMLAADAPGTFTHSVMVGNLAEAACEKIGANGLLARVGAYYHDLGKTKAPRYFAENQTGRENPHDRLKPHLSALVIRNHVKDGARILEKHGLPDEIVDFVWEHHGTSLIKHFYNRARRDAQPTGEHVEESDFRYPGPKPQRKETAIVMIADSVEAASKALPEPTPAKIEALVQRIIASQLEDGQFDECDLTLRELAVVEQTVVKVLVGMNHVRPVYLPGPEGDGKRGAGGLVPGQVSTEELMVRARSFANPAAGEERGPPPPRVIRDTSIEAALPPELTGQRDPIRDTDPGQGPASPTAVVSGVTRTASTQGSPAERPARRPSGVYRGRDSGGTS